MDADVQEFKPRVFMEVANLDKDASDDEIVAKLAEVYEKLKQVVVR